MQDHLPKFKFPRQMTFLVLTGLILSAGAVSQQTGLASPLSQSTPSSKLTVALSLPESVDKAVRQAVSEQFNVPLSKIKVVSFTQESWSDGCLGLGGAAESCLSAIVEGWRVEVTDGQQNWIYRTDQTAKVVRLEPQSNSATLPADTLQRLLKAVAKQVNIPQNRLTVAAVRSLTWDSCRLGAMQRDCPALPGWQAIVNNSERSWVYHLNESATRIAQNRTASGSRGGLVPSFIPEENKFTIDENVVFQSIVSGDLTGRMTQLTLTKDGLMTQLITAPNIRSRPVVVKRLSRSQVEQFQQILKTQQFRRLDNLRYLSSAAFADYPTTTLQSADGTVQYLDLERKNLPRAFQTVIQAWERLSSSAKR